MGRTGSEDSHVQVSVMRPRGWKRKLEKQGRYQLVKGSQGGTQHSSRKCPNEHSAARLVGFKIGFWHLLMM